MVSNLKALTVSEYVKITDQSLRSFGFANVIGEISSLSFRNHLYFTIKDDTSSVDCMMWANNVRRLPFEPRIGQQVSVLGQSTLYSKNGFFKLMANEMILDGRGQIMEQLRALEQRLEREGVFNNRRPLPRVISRVGVITSIDGRVIDDIATNTFKRNTLVSLTFIDTKVQGPDAAISLCNALIYAYRNYQRYGFDVLIIGRGGGSFEDLLCFSDERVVRLVAQSPIPIISAVGHDEDRPLCDRSADLRVSTPTAAAEAITPCTNADLIEWINGAAQRLDNALLTIQDDYVDRFDRLYERLKSNRVEALINEQNMRLNLLQSHLDQAVKNKLNQVERYIDASQAQIERVGVASRIEGYKTRLVGAETKLDRVPALLEQKGELLAQSFNYLYNHSIKSRLDHLMYQLNVHLLPKLDYGMGRSIAKYEGCLKDLNAVLDNKFVSFEQQLNFIPERINSFVRRLDHALGKRLNEAHNYLTKLESQLHNVGNSSTSSLVFDYEQRINKAIIKLEQIPKQFEQKLELVDQRVEHNLLLRLNQAMENHIGKIENKLAPCEQILELDAQHVAQKKLAPPSYLEVRTKNADARISKLMQSLETVSVRLDRTNNYLSISEQGLALIYDKLLAPQLNNYNERIVGITSKMEGLNPIYQLQRGLSITTMDKKHPVKGEDIKVGDNLITLLQGYAVHSNVTKVEPNELISNADAELIEAQGGGESSELE